MLKPKPEHVKMMEVVKLAHEFDCAFETFTFRRNDVAKAVRLMITGDITPELAEKRIWQIIADLNVDNK